MEILFDASRIRTEELREFQEKFDLNFNDIGLLDQSLTHKSFFNEDMEVECNEKLEFLGDSVLGLVIGEYVYRTYPDYSEGELSKLKSVLVSEVTLAKKAREMSLGDYIRLGRGEMLAGGNNKSSILADTLEALIGAIYTDSGLNKARNFVIEHFADEVKLVDGDEDKDYKTLLQELVQSYYFTIPTYRTVREFGPDHEKTFEVEVLFGKRSYGIGTGRSKKRAEQMAAKEALEILKKD